MEILRLLWIIIIILGGIKIFLGLPWGLGDTAGWGEININTPKKKVSIYFILVVLVIQYIYWHFFLYSEINSALQLSFGVGIPVGILGVAFYQSVYKRKKEGKAVSALINDDESNVTELLDSMRKACPENKLSRFEEESRKIRAKFTEAPKKDNTGFLNINWEDYLNNALGFSVVFLAVYTFYKDFFQIFVGFFIK